MGEVYLVTHPRLPRQDALKVLPTAISADPEFRTRFEREADLAATLWHPHIVGVHDRGEDHGRLWIAMDYVAGHDAAALVRDQWPNGMPPTEVAAIVTAVAEALDYAHTRQLLHRDVKPANILLTDDASDKRRILLADFGIARHTEDTAGLTATNMTVGSVNYTAPEQLMGEPIDARADQYALAATAYHLLTGTVPFPHANPAVVISRHLNTAPPSLASTHPELATLDPVLATAMAKNPEDRYPSTTDFATALTTTLTGTTTTSTATTSTTTHTTPPTTAASTPITEPPTTFVETPAHDAPPVHQSSWGATRVDDIEEERLVAPPPPLATPTRRGLHPVVVGVAVAAAILLVAMITFAILQSTVGGSSHSAPPTTSQAPPSSPTTAIALPSVASPSRATTAATPVSQANCGVKLRSPAVMRAVASVQPRAEYQLDPANAWGNFNPCTELSVALIPTAMGTGSSPVQALMFHNGDYVGPATPEGIGYLQFNQAKTTDDTVVLTFRVTIGTCGGCDDGTYADVRFQFRNGAVVALDPIPKLMAS
jgi:serine/threonine protein kinase, bacterial